MRRKYFPWFRNIGSDKIVSTVNNSPLNGYYHLIAAQHLVDVWLSYKGTVAEAGIVEVVE